VKNPPVTNNLFEVILLPNLLKYIFCFLVSEGKRSGGITAVWVARNRFAVLDKTHTVRDTAVLTLVREYSLENKILQVAVLL
jgi:hypothetical protein